MKEYAVVFETASNNWAAYVPDLPGCVTTGKTLEETRRLIAEAIEFHIEGMRLNGESVPEPTAVAESGRPAKWSTSGEHQWVNSRERRRDPPSYVEYPQSE